MQSLYGERGCNCYPRRSVEQHWRSPLGGRFLGRSCRLHLIDLPVVAVSATPHDTLALGGAGYDASLLKPISLVELRHVLSRLLHLPIKQSSNDVEAPALPTPRLSGNDLAQVQLLLESGAISDLIDWARALQARDAAFTDFNEQLRRMARQGDIAAIRKLCETMRAA